MNKNINKKTVISGVIAVLLVYIIFARIDFSCDIPSLPSWDEKITEITINKKESSIRIYKEKEKWFINKEAYPADKTTVENLIKKMKELKIVEKVSEKPFYTNYDLTPEKYIEVMVKAGKDNVRRNIKLGKKSSTQHTFVRLKDKPEVYMASGTFSEFDKKADDFRDKEIINLAKEAVISFEIAYKNRKLQFHKEVKEVADITGKEQKKKTKMKKLEEWKCKDYNFVELDGSKINSLLSSLSPIRANTFPNMDKKALSNPICTFKANAYGREITLEIFERMDPEDKEGKKKIYYALASESPYVFTLNEWKAKKFFLENIEGLKKTK